MRIRLKIRVDQRQTNQSLRYRLNLDAEHITKYRSILDKSFSIDLAKLVKRQMGISELRGRVL